MERLRAVGTVLLGSWIGALGFGVDPPAARAEIRRACHQAALRWPYTITFRFLAWPKED